MCYLAVEQALNQRRPGYICQAFFDLYTLVTTSRRAAAPIPSVIVAAVDAVRKLS